MDEILRNVILPVVLALIASSPGIYVLVVQRRKDKVDAGAVVTDSAIDLMKQYQDRLDKMDKRQSELELEVKALKVEISGRDDTIEKLETENKDLQEQVVKLRRENESLRKRVKELETKLFTLTHGTA